METSVNFWLVFVAGMASVFSPCVLPVIPIVVTGSVKDHKFRPILIIAGIALSFILMGVLSSMFGALLGPLMYRLEKVAAILIVIFGILLVLNINLFKSLSFFTRLAEKSNGRLNGFLLGLVLGLVWIPCVGPILASVLMMVATKGSLLGGVLYLAVYSVGFAIPMLIAGFAAQFFRSKIRVVNQFPKLMNLVSGLVLVALGLFIFFKGILGFSSLA